MKILTSLKKMISVTAFMLAVVLAAGNVSYAAAGTSADTSASTTAAVTKLAAVSNLKSKPTYGKIKLSWNEVAGADGYRVYRSTSKDGDYKKIVTTSDNVYEDENISFNKTYYYKVRAYYLSDDKKKFGGYSDVVKQKSTVAKTKITDVSAKSYNSLKIAWKKVKGASGYKVYYSTSQDGDYELLTTVTSGSTLSCVHKKVSCGKIYYYKVVAYRTYNGKKCNGPYSAVVSGRTKPNATAISFSDSKINAASNVLVWDKASGCAGYKIYRSTEEDSGYKKVATVKGQSTLTWTDKDVEKGTTYYYKIRTYKTVSGSTVHSKYSSVFEASTTAQKIASLREYEGYQYVYGGTSVSGWDCSGFVQYVMNKKFGISMPRTCREQVNCGTTVSKSDQSKWKPGDLIFFKSSSGVSHVGIYLGDGKMIHALNSKYDTLVQDVDYYEKWDRGNTLCNVKRVIE